MRGTSCCSSTPRGRLSRVGPSPRAMGPAAGPSGRHIAGPPGRSLGGTRGLCRRHGAGLRDVRGLLSRCLRRCGHRAIRPDGRPRDRHARPPRRVAFDGQGARLLWWNPVRGPGRGRPPVAVHDLRGPAPALSGAPDGLPRLLGGSRCPGARVLGPGVAQLVKGPIWVTRRRPSRGRICVESAVSWCFRWDLRRSIPCP